MSWTLPTAFAESPENVDPTDGFYNIVPPTPQHYAGLQPTFSRDAADQSSRDYLGPTLKSHRSMSSVGSIDSHFSHRSNLSQGSNLSNISQGDWSNVDSSEPTSSEGDNDGPGITQGGYTYPGHAFATGERVVGQPQRGNSLSIDPRLFQPREKVVVTGASGLIGSNMDGQTEIVVPVVEDEERVVTAKPKRSPKKSSSESKKKVSHARKQHPEHIPRPRNAFILFRKHVVDSKLIPPSVEMRHQNVSVIVAKMWSEAGAEQKAHFNDLARIEKEEHMRKYPGYRYQPVYRRTNVIRRRVRKDDAEEEKCQSVADLLMKGKSGEALEAEIKDKIKRDAPAPTPKKKSQSVAGANELSKGALRALRAQARHQSTPSVDWSEASFSRADSSEVDLAPFGAVGSMAYEMPGGDMPYMTEPEGMYGDSMGNYDWNFGVSIGQGSIPVQQTYAYPQEDAGPSQYMYPQPDLRPTPADLPVAPEFYTYDQALPFSPTAGSFGIQMTSNAPMMSLETTMSDPNELFLEQYPSPTSGLYGAGLSGPLRVPMSARWDRAHGGNGHYMLPSSSEVPLEGLFETAGGVPGEGEDMLLHDFGAALAQTDDGAW